MLHFHVNKLVAFRDFHFVFLYVFTHVYTCTSVSHYFCQELTSPQQRGLVHQQVAAVQDFATEGKACSQLMNFAVTLMHELWFRPVTLNAHPH